MRVFITGMRGQLGRALSAVLQPGGHTVEGGDLPGWDMLDAGQVRESLAAFRPDVVIHAGALTRVDYCAEHPREAVAVNGVGTYNVALACQRLGIRMVYISTNEVFDGRATRPYQEYDPRHPANPYGYSKYVGEQVVERLLVDYLIVRTSWLFAPGGVNFIHRVRERALSGAPVQVVTDEIGSPTYVTDLADGLIRLIETDRPGIYHLTNQGHCSRYYFAVEALRLSGLEHVTITPITSDAFTRPSTPPLFSPLDNIFAAVAGVELRPWQAAVADYIATYPQG